MKKFYLLSILLVGLLGWMQAQPTFEIDDATGDPGGVVSINFKVKDFTGIVGMQFSINWDPTVLQFAEIKNITNEINAFDGSAFNTDANRVDNGQILFQWFDTGAEGNTLADGTIIFTIDFTIVGGSGSSTNITISDDPRKIEIIDESETNIGLNVTDGTFTATGMGGGGSLRLLGSDEIGSLDETVCVDITAQGFSNIAGMQFSLSWDPAFLQFSEVTNFNLDGLNEGTFNTDDVANGKIGLQWNDPDVAGITLGNNTRIFSICFKILGSEGNSTVAFASEPVSIEFVDGDDNRVTFNKKDGSVSTDGGGGGTSDCNAEGFAMEASVPANVDAGSEVCVDFKVKDFIDITTLGATVEWDNAVITNPRIESINLDGLNENLFNLDQGANGLFSFVWIDNTTEGINLPDGSILFTICYNVVGSEGQSTTVSFTDMITDREVSQLSIAIPFNQCDGVINVGNGSGLNISSSLTTPSCAGEFDGAIDISVSGGTEPYTYSWTRGGSAVSTDEDLSNVSAGTYTVNIADGTGLEASRNIVLNDPVGVRIINAVIVEGSGMDGSIALTLSGGSTPLDFAWSNGATTRDIAGLAFGTYGLTITEANGCTLDTSFNVGAGDLMVQIDLTDLSCTGENDGAASANVNGGGAPYTYSWSNGETTSSISGLEPGSYAVTVTDAAGTTVEASGDIDEPNQLVVNVETTPSPNNSEGTALAQVSGGTGPYTYRWNDGNPPSTTRLIINLPQGSFSVLVTDDNGCQAQAIGDIGESDVPCFSARLVMTPNGDGRNDEFDLACTAGTDNELQVFNRQGELVYEATNYSNDWLGVDQGGEELVDGAYYWVLQVRRNGILEQFKGHVTILRNLN
ncbi:MAG: T9SS type B sorting domain-containing protein [Saprospiraceae bacterium]|nr:T9SS type B sorting domain-containing protein [Saprospiraceae bacterium]